MNNTQKYLIVNHVLYLMYYTSHIHIKKFRTHRIDTIHRNEALNDTFMQFLKARKNVAVVVRNRVISETVSRSYAVSW
jgi:hypothetical protein